MEIRNWTYASWLERELDVRAGYECVDTMEEFRRAGKAITRVGQIKGSGGRHEKNDTTRIGDRGSYVLGWSNQQKIDALLAKAATLGKRQNQANDEHAELKKALSGVNSRIGVLTRLDTFQEYAELDWHGQVNLIAELSREKRALEQSSGVLARIAVELAKAETDITEAED